MWAMSEIICLLSLAVISVRDIQTRKVSVYLLLAAGVSSVVYQVCMGKMEWQLVLAGAAVGIGFLIISKLSDEGIGYGDSLAIMILGIYLGLWNLLLVLAAAFFLLLCVMIPVLWRKRMSRKCALPFFPFLTGGYLCFLLMGGRIS